MTADEPGTVSGQGACCAPTRTGDAGATPTRRTTAAGTGVPDLRLVPVPAGAFVQGNQRGDGYPGDGEGPAREVHLDAYRIAATAVTNDEFARFVSATGHRTVAEALGDSFVFGGLLPDDFPPTQAVAAAP